MISSNAATLAYRKAVAKTRDRAKTSDSMPPWLEEIAAELPEDDSHAAPGEIEETKDHRSRRTLEKSTHPYDRVSWLVHRFVTSQAWFEGFIMVCILLVGVATGLELENDGRSERTSEAVNTVSFVTLIIFTFEAVLKVVSEGREPWRYVTDSTNGMYNLFDLSTVIASYAFMGQGGGGAVGGLRMLRLFRLLSFVKRIPQLRIMMAGVVQGIKSTGIICVLLGLVIYMFAILACLLFGENDPVQFGAVGASMLTLFQVSTLAGWTNIAYVSWYGCDNFLESPYGDGPSKIQTLTGEFQGMLCNKNSTASPLATTLFYSFYIIITAWVVMSLFIGVISMGMFEVYQTMKEEERQLRKNDRLDENSRLYRMREDEPLLKKLIDTVLDDDSFDLDHTPTKFEYASNLAKKIRDSVAFLVCVTLTIIISAVTIGVDTNDEMSCARLKLRVDDPSTKCDTRNSTLTISWVAQAIFTVEVVVKILAERYKPYRYFIDQEQGSWNSLDFFVVVVGYVGETQVGRTIFDNFPVVILKLLRLLRAFRLAKAIPRLRSIVEALFSGLSAVVWIFVLIVIFNYITACVCMSIFRDNDPFHFGTVGRSMFTMVKMETLDNWEEILYLTVLGCSNYPLYDYALDNPKMRCKEDKSFGFGWLGAIIISSIIIIGGYVLPTVLIGIVSIRFEEASRYAETARHLKKNIKPVLEHARKDLPNFFSHLRLEACRSLFDQMDTDSSLSLEYMALAPFYHYAFAKLFNVELTPGQCESNFLVMDQDQNADVSFDEFVHFVATLKKIETRCKADKVYAKQIFRTDSRSLQRSNSSRAICSIWNRAMARTNHESLELAWNVIFASLNGLPGENLTEKTRSLYSTFDSDNSGHIDKEELARGLDKCKCHMGAEQMHAFVAAVDENGDGLLDFEEFLNLIKQQKAIRDEQKQKQDLLEAESMITAQKKHHHRLSEVLTDRDASEPVQPEQVSESRETSSTISASDEDSRIVVQGQLVNCMAADDPETLITLSPARLPDFQQSNKERELQSMRDLFFPSEPTRRVTFVDM